MGRRSARRVGGADRHRVLAELLDPRVAYGVDVSDLKPFIGIAKTLKWDLEKKR